MPVHCAITTVRGPGLSASSPAGPGVSDPKEPRHWAAEHLQTLECARTSFSAPGRSTQKSLGLSGKGKPVRPQHDQPRCPEDRHREEDGQLKIQQRGSGQGPGREGKVGEASGQSERRRM